MIPWQRPRVREIAERLFLAQPQWRTRDLIREAYSWHIENGGMEIRSPDHTMRRVLDDLREEERIISVSHGYWCWNDIGDQISSSSSLNAVSNEPDVLPPIEDSGTNPEIDKGTVLCPEIELGNGSECVYVYYNENDKRLAKLENRKAWECKVGRTSDSTVTHRILHQGINTALSRTPTVGLVIHTEDSSLLERALHCTLRMAGADYDEAIGAEWFITSPQAIKEWYTHQLNGIDALKSEESEQDNAADALGAGDF